LKRPEPAEKKKRILVVDDEPNIRRIASLWLRETMGGGYEVLEAAEGAEAVRLAIEKQPDLILLDIMMPGMDGLEACRLLKDNPATSHIPVVFLTAKGEEETIGKGIELGGEAYVVKPFHAITLTAQVREILARSQ